MWLAKFNIFNKSCILLLHIPSPWGAHARFLRLSLYRQKQAIKINRIMLTSYRQEFVAIFNTALLGHSVESFGYFSGKSICFVGDVGLFCAYLGT
jgi:hypothetical protein